VSGIIKLLAPVKGREVMTGEVVQRRTSGMYQVKIGRRTLPVQSLVVERLPKNSQVVVVQIDRGLYIINKEHIKDRQALEVIING
jgi:membrane protein implicated in regulation of membrane protease activity